jgi:hypothetical protein
MRIARRLLCRFCIPTERERADVNMNSFGGVTRDASVVLWRSFYCLSDRLDARHEHPR